MCSNKWFIIKSNLFLFISKMTISICTIYAKRVKNLQNLVKGLTMLKHQPAELAIVCMDDELPELPITKFPIKSTRIDRVNGKLPLSEARNTALSMISTEKVIFLDVDCIPGHNIIPIFDYLLDKEDAIYSGSVKYLPENWEFNHWTIDDLSPISEFHPVQGQPVYPPDIKPHPYELFWSLCFAMNKTTFKKLGMFEEIYTGYGGEDTDLAFKARKANIPHYKVGALAYHQYHMSCQPPLNHIEDIVTNSKIFYDRWNELPMGAWLKSFKERGYISMGKGKDISILKLPSNQEVQECVV